MRRIQRTGLSGGMGLSGGVGAALRAIVVGIGVVTLSQVARADAIDGDWCDGTRRISIDGPSITTPGGNRIISDYDRHAARFAVPAGEPDAGATVDMILMGEENVQVRIGAEPPKVWRRCKNTS